MHLKVTHEMISLGKKIVGDVKWIVYDLGCAIDGVCYFYAFYDVFIIIKL